MINDLIGKGNVNEQLTKSCYYFTRILLNKNQYGLNYCQVFYFGLN